jgi:hypothetical protein
LIRLTFASAAPSAWTVAILLAGVAAACGGTSPSNRNDGGPDGSPDDLAPQDVATPDLATQDLATQDGSADQTATVTQYDLGVDFSFGGNPNGPWRYGYSPTATLAALPIMSDVSASPTTPVGFWHPTDAAYYPYIAVNQTAATVADPTNSWAVRGHEVAMEGSQVGQYSMIQFTAPRRGSYEVQADFAGIHFRISSTDVHVFQGDTSLFDAQIDGYGGDPAFHAVQGASPTASYHATRALNAGDTLTFFVGIGANGSFNNDTTGLFVHITETD